MNIMNSETSSDTLPDPSMGELESQDPQGQSTPNVDFIDDDDDDDDDNTALNVCIDNVPVALPLCQQKIFTNPLTYNYEETINCLQRIIENDGVPQSSPAPSAAPNVKPAPQAETRGVKRAREPEPSPPKQPTGRNGRRAAKTVKPEEANEPKRPRYRLLAPKSPNIDVPCQQQALPVNMLPSRADFQYRNAPVPSAATGGAVRDLGQQPNRHLQLAQMGFNPPVTPSSHSGSTTWSSPGSSAESWETFSTNTSMDGGTFMGRPATQPMEPGPMLPQQQALMGMNPHSFPSPHDGNIAFSSPVPPPQQVHNGMTMGSMGHHSQLGGNGIPMVCQNAPPNSSVGHLQPRVNSKAMKMHQHNGPFMGNCQPSRFG